MALIDMHPAASISGSASNAVRNVQEMIGSRIELVFTRFERSLKQSRQKLAGPDKRDAHHGYLADL